MRSKLPKILVTGGAGFIGSEFVRQAVHRKLKIVVVDKLTYAGDLTRIKKVLKKIHFYKTDITSHKALEKIFKKERPDIVVHFAAETHVDRSIQDVFPFIETNIKGTQNLIELSLKFKIKKFIHISTDEVYGQIEEGNFYEHSPLSPNNPYSATKAAADHLIRAAIRTYHLPAIIVRPSNNYGPWQYPEKLIPVIILKALHNQKVPIYGKGRNIREWLYVSDCANAIFTIMEQGQIGEIYNIGSKQESRNIDTVKTILDVLEKPHSLINFVQDRPGHDFRYSLDIAKIKKLGWSAQTTLKDGILKTVSWNQEHFHWLESKLQFLKSYWKKIYKNKEKTI